MRGGFLEGDARLGIHQVLGIMMEFAGLVVQDRKRALAHSEGGHHRGADAFLIAFSRLEFVYYQLYEMPFVAVQGLDIVQIQDFPVDPDLGIAFFAEGVEKLTVMALSAAHQRSEQQAFAALVVRHYQIHYLLVGVAHHLLAAYGRVCGGGAGVEETQEVGDFRNGSDGGPGVVASGFLLYGDDGAEAFDAFYLGFVQDPHKVLGVGREGIQVAALAFGVDGVECQ